MLKLYSTSRTCNALIGTLCPASWLATPISMLHIVSRYRHKFQVDLWYTKTLPSFSSKTQRNRLATEGIICARRQLAHRPLRPLAFARSSISAVTFVPVSSMMPRMPGHHLRTDIAFRRFLPDRPGMLPDQGKDCLTKLIKEGEAGVGVEYALTVRAILLIVRSSSRLSVSL